MSKNETNPVIIANGECGECTWTIDADGLLLIAPTDGVRGLLENISIGTDLWQDHRELIRDVNIAEGVIANTELQWMFTGCKNMVTADLRNLDTSNVYAMGWMFDGCSSLTSLYVSETFGLDANAEYLFYDSPHLVVPDVPGLAGLMTCVRDEPDDAYGAPYVRGICGECTCTIYYGGLLVIAPTDDEASGKLDELIGSTPWKRSGYQEDIKSVKFEPLVYANFSLVGMFSECKNMTSVDFDDVEGLYLGFAGMEKMFESCESLVSIDLSRFLNLEILTDYTFKDCKALTNVILPESVTTIYGRAFSGCKNLTTVTIPNNMGAYTTEYSSEGDRSWEVANRSRHIDKDAFKDCPVTLIVRRGSWVEDYAKDNGIPYKYLADTKAKEKPVTRSVVKPVEKPVKKPVGKSWEEKFGKKRTQSKKRKR